jgi:hypothetical protein
VRELSRTRVRWGVCADAGCDDARPRAWRSARFSATKLARDRSAESSAPTTAWISASTVGHLLSNRPAMSAANRTRGCSTLAPPQGAPRSRENLAGNVFLATTGSPGSPSTRATGAEVAARGAGPNAVHRCSSPLRDRREALSALKGRTPERNTYRNGRALRATRHMLRREGSIRAYPRDSAWSRGWHASRFRREHVTRANRHARYPATPGESQPIEECAKDGITGCPARCK